MSSKTPSKNEIQSLEKNMVDSVDTSVKTAVVSYEKACNLIKRFLEPNLLF
jgi:hypothetical protein